MEALASALGSHEQPGVRAAAPARGGRPPLDLAIAGTRGVPACYSGFETFAEELGTRLAARGHSVTVYGRIPYVGREQRRYLGMKVVPVRSPRGKHFETLLHTLSTGLVSLRAGHDVVLLCNGANAVAAPLFRLGGARVALNVDGIDRLRRKWGLAGKLWFLLGERLSLHLPDVPLTDAECIADYYRRRYGRELEVIPYGGERMTHGYEDADVLQRFGLEPGRYVLVVGRLEPENNALLVVQAYRRVAGDLPLVVVGDAPYADAYKERLRAAAGPRVVFTGGIYGDGYVALQSNACCYVAAGEVGGTHPALVEAMTFGPAIVANDVPEHREVLGESCLYYPPGDEAALAGAIQRVLDEPGLAERLQGAAQARAAARYRWDRVVERYEALFYGMLAGARRA